LSITIGGLDILQIIRVVAAFFVTYVVAKVFTKVLGKVFERTPFPEQVEGSIVRVSKYVIYAIGFFVVISLIGVDLTSVVLGLGAFSIAISFATSNIIQNLVSGVLVIGDRAFAFRSFLASSTSSLAALHLSCRSHASEPERRTLSTYSGFM